MRTSRRPQVDPRRLATVTPQKAPDPHRRVLRYVAILRISSRWDDQNGRRALDERAAPEREMKR